jgi:uncharacterized protein YndB with AHSA1/START domain
MMNLPHKLDRTILIHASRDIVFRYFTDDERWSSWWGAGSTIEPRPGGRVVIRYPGAVEATGEVVEVAVPERLVFTYGYTSGKPIPAGSSRVTIRLAEAPRGTRLDLVHELPDAAVRDAHVQGWRYQLSVFANLVADDLHRGADGIAAKWFEAWSETDATARRQLLESVANADVHMRDKYSCIDGVEELTEHIAGAQRFMPDMHIRQKGTARHCQGVLLVDWVAASKTGEPKGSGTNVFVLGPDNRIESVTGFWSAPSQG